MEKNEIHVGSDCAYLKGDSRPFEPVRAVVLDEPSGGYVNVVLYHPDAGQYQERVRTRELVGLWGDEPEERFTAYRDLLTQAHADGRLFTWADAAERRYNQVRRQRALAGRLANMGIVREPRHYAGKGGGSENAKDSQLQLNHDELDALLRRAEMGPDAPYVPPNADAELEVAS